MKTDVVMVPSSTQTTSNSLISLLKLLVLKSALILYNLSKYIRFKYYIIFKSNGNH